MNKKLLSAIVSTILFGLFLWGGFLFRGTDSVASPSVIPSEAAAEPRDLDPGSQVPPLVADSSVGMTEGTTTNALVIRAVDGDTLAVTLDGDDRELKVRLLGVDTPETVDPRKAVQCFGKEASAFTKSLVDGKRVRLDADPLADEVDKYGRLLRNVVLEDGRDVNALLIQEGYAYAYLSFPLNPLRKTQLKRLQTEAEEAKRGLWSPDGCNGQTE